MQDLPERRVTVAMTIQTGNLVDELLGKFSNINKLIRVFAYVMRYLRNLRAPKADHYLNPFKPEELDDALKEIIATVQKNCFPEEYNCLLNGRVLSSSSKILNLNPILHERLMRVGGRIKYSKQVFDKLHPIILPKGNILTDLIVKDEHERLLHAGTQTLLSSLRERYWPISGRNLCKKIIKGCIKCFSVKPTSTKYLMGDLPEMRVNRYLPFLNVGTDFCGPFWLKNKGGRGSKNQKAYVCLFVCMCTKAVHLELVSDLTTDAFLAALQRFVSRRGKPSSIHSDNALNYVGAKNELAKVHTFLKSNNNDIANRLAVE